MKTGLRDAEALLCAVTGQTTASLIAAAERPLPEREAEAFQSLLERRARGEPVAYLLGQKEFWSLTLTVTPDVLIPRPETELLVEEALAHATRHAVATLLETRHRQRRHRPGAGERVAAVRHRRHRYFPRRPGSGRTATGKNFGKNSPPAPLSFVRAIGSTRSRGGALTSSSPTHPISPPATATCDKATYALNPARLWYRPPTASPTSRASSPAPATS